MYEQNARMNLEMKPSVTPTKLPTPQTHASTTTSKVIKLGRLLHYKRIWLGETKTPGK